ncbi:hypothetical protein MNEG_5158 [Monoraphidium neglectum]|uniref:Uncharacterized protein n=1 Tax=Monoraphidium neglectum TaxID=145388 RepID=A0A0D2MQW3_9CHLO|nr:hypothetical protein MNEG_5158 [Monoraphidium neglectum]KIZ02807.1 hypothetical protein MNEG_5158 [Monoraphidium neglectum]|eukprot:XP_013901826.1 hypothetical protein MNEG_5158 [Monoraphidium neglectum]
MSELKGGAWDGLKIVTEGAVNKGPRESESSLSMASCTEEDSLDTEALAAPDQPSEF